MYRRKNKGWLKHLDFIILDLLCLQVCFALAYFSRHGFGGNPHKVIYQNMMLVLVLFEFIYAFFLEGYKDILKRGHYVEFVSVVKQVCILELFKLLPDCCKRRRWFFKNSIVSSWNLSIGNRVDDQNNMETSCKKISDRGRKLLSFIDYNIENGRRSIKENQRE